MLGRDYSAVGSAHTVVGRLGEYHLWRGRVRVRWLNRSAVVLIDSKKNAFVLSLRGNVEVCLKHVAADKDGEAAANARDSAAPDAEEEEAMWWFEDPRALLISRKEKEAFALEQRRAASIAAAERVEPMRTIRLNCLSADFAGLATTDGLQILAADASSQTIKVLERDRDWRIDRSIGDLGNALGAHYGISGVATFRIDDENTLICTCDNELNRVQIFESTGDPLATLGTEGPKGGQFRRPCAISTFVKLPSTVPRSRAPLTRDALCTPAWFLGACEKEELQAYLMDRDLEVNVGDFCMCSRPDNPRIYDLLYLNKSYRPVPMVIRRVPQSEGGKEVFIQSKEGRGLQNYPSIWHLILSQKQLRKPVVESRPVCYIAVADAENYRVQILRYFWTDSEIFTPSLDYLLTIGGPRGLLFPLRDPIDVSYSPTGELAIAETDRVVILTPSMTLAKVVTLPYSPFLLTREQRELKAREELSRAEDEAKAAAEGKRSSGGGGGGATTSAGTKAVFSNDSDDFHVDRTVKWPSWAAAAAAAAAAASSNDQESKASSGLDGAGASAEAIAALTLNEADHKICSVSFATDGKLAVGYRSGGVLIFSPYKSLPCGVFHVLTLPCFDCILSFCSFADLESVRACCRLFHNYTRDLRFEWRLGAMRTKYFDVMAHSFLRWCTNNAGELAFGQMGDFCDVNGKQICKHWIETASCPLKKSCPFSHGRLQDLGFREHYPPAKDVGLELSHFLLAAYTTFGAKFVWQKERYMEELFREYSVDVDRLQRRRHRSEDSVGGAMLRSVAVEPTRVLSFKNYVDIMALLEEDFVGSKPIQLHPLFHRYERGAMQPRGPYDFDSIEKRIYVDPQEQYNHGLGISCVPLKTKVVKFLRGMEADQTRGQGASAAREHIETVQHLGLKTERLLSRMFSPAAAGKK